eukprot:364533-Chlamydomonas_euryale.AAC.14
MTTIQVGGGAWMCESQSHREQTHDGYAYVERNKTEGIKQQAERRHKGNATASGPANQSQTHSRVRVTGSGPTSGMPVFSAGREEVIKQRTPPNPTPIADAGTPTAAMRREGASAPPRVPSLQLRLWQAWTSNKHMQGQDAAANAGLRKSGSVSELQGADPRGVCLC